MDKKSVDKICQISDKKTSMKNIELLAGLNEDRNSISMQNCKSPAECYNKGIQNFKLPNDMGDGKMKIFIILILIVILGIMACFGNWDNYNLGLAPIDPRKDSSAPRTHCTDQRKDSFSPRTPCTDYGPT